MRSFALRVISVFCCLYLAIACSQAHAQAYPSKPIRLLVGLAPGGGTDVIARIVAAKLSEGIGQQVLVENRVGSGGLLAADAAAKAASDGYMLLFGGVSNIAIFPSLYKKLPYDPVKDFAPISLVAAVPNVLVVNPNLPVKNVSELVAWAKANPGKLSYGSSG